MSVSPDEGMQLLQQRYAANEAVSQAALPEAAAGSPSAGGGFELGAMLGVMVRAATSMESMAAELKAARRHQWEKVHPVEIPPVDRNLAGSQTTAGIYKDPDRWGPQDGWAWRIFGWTQTLGPGATGYSIYYDDPGDPTNLILASSSSGRWEPSHFYLTPGRNICFTSQGGPLIVGKGIAAEIAIDYLPTYMGLKP